MSDLARGTRIKERRLALDIKSVREFAELTGIHREALTKVERGLGSEATLERVEAWLSRREADAGTVKLTFRGIIGIGELIAEGPADRPEDLVASITGMLDHLRKSY